MYSQIHIYIVHTYRYFNVHVERQSDCPGASSSNSPLCSPRSLEAQEAVRLPRCKVYRLWLLMMLAQEYVKALPSTLIVISSSNSSLCSPRSLEATLSAPRAAHELSGWLAVA